MLTLQSANHPCSAELYTGLVHRVDTCTSRSCQKQTAKGKCLDCHSVIPSVAKQDRLVGGSAICISWHRQGMTCRAQTCNNASRQYIDKYGSNNHHSRKRAENTIQCRRCESNVWAVVQTILAADRGSDASKNVLMSMFMICRKEACSMIVAL